MYDVPRHGKAGGDVSADLIEQLAAIEHERWASWQSYLHGKCERTPDGGLAIPAALVERWERQIATPYADLSDAEKASDREQVMRYWPLIEEYKRQPEETRPLRIVALEQTCGSHPSQWEGESDAGAAVYVRFRSGCLRVHVGPSIDDALDREPVFLWEDEDDPANSFMAQDEMIARLPDWITVEMPA